VLVEREREVDEISRLLSLAKSGAGATLLIEGEAGIGKSSLLEHAQRLAATAKVRVLRARAGELERDLGFSVVRQLFDPVLTGLGEPDRELVLTGAARHARAPLGLTDATPGPENEATALHGLYWLCSGLADRGPLMIGVDDVQWADEPSLRFLSYVARRVGDLPILICVTSRPEHDPSRVRAALDSEWSHVLRPAPLSESGVTQVVHRLLSGSAAPEFCAACARSTGGNPFLLVEALAALRAADVEPSADEVYRLDGLRPETIARTLLGRISRLGPAATATTRAVAVLGSDANLRRCASLARLPVEAAGSAFADLRRAGILATGTEVELAHPLVHTAVYADIDRTTRALDHLRAAELLRGEHAPVARVAAHLLLSEPSGSAWVVEQLRAGAAAALAHGAPHSAAVLLERALTEPPADDARTTLLLELGTAHAREGASESAVEHLRAALDLTTDVPARFAVVLELSRALVLGGRNAEAAEVLEAALEEFAGEESLALALEFELAGASHLGKPAGEWSARLAAVAARAPGPTLGERAIRALHAYVAASTGSLDAAQVAALARSSTSEAPEEEDPPQLLQVVAAGLAMAGDFDAGIAVLDRGLEATRQAGDAALFGFLSLTRSWIAYRSGRVLEAEADAVAGLTSAAEGPPNVAYAVGALVVALIERHDLDGAEHTLAEHGLTDVTTLDALPSASLFFARGRLRLFQGRAAEAVRDLQTSRDMLAQAGFTSPVFVEWRPSLAVALVACGDRGAATAVADEDVAVCRTFGSPRELGMALRARGLVAGGEPGLRLLHESAQVLEGSGSVLEHARTLVDLGAELRRAGRRSEAREPLLRGLDLASTCGSVLVAEQAREELLAVGARPRRARTTGPESLTAGELRVARLAAAGRSNPEIAQGLFVTRRTVEVHLTNAYRKLGIRSRDQLRESLGPLA
jgi:DNA-binding CsgD family transcriptional regulator